MKVLVTGSSGFIGSHTVHQLNALGMEVVEFDLANGDDVTDAGAVAKAMAGTDATIHLAGVLGTHELWGDPRAAFDVNVGGALNVLDAAVNQRDGYRFVIINQPHIWYNPYQASKQAAVRMARAYEHEYGIETVSVEVWNAFGPGQAYGAGHPQKIIPTFAMAAWQGGPCEIWGDGTQLVDLVWVGDVAQSLAGALVADERQVVAGSGVGLEVVEVAVMVDEMVVAQGGPGYSEVRTLPMRSGETSKTAAVAHVDGSFKREMLALTVAWYGEQARPHVEDQRLYLQESVSSGISLRP